MPDKSKLPINRVDGLNNELTKLNNNIDIIQNDILNINNDLNNINVYLNFTGMIVSALNINAPKGWLLCNGQAISRTDYAELFEVIGTTFGSGDGTSTFNIPNYSGKFLQMDTSKSIGQSIEAGLPNITGSYYQNNIAAGGFAGISFGGYIDGAFIEYINPRGNIGRYSSPSGETEIGLGFDASKSNSIYGKSNTVQPPASIVNYFIKY